jgi:hypothetical protein
MSLRMLFLLFYYLNALNLTPNLALKEVYEVICGEEERRFHP